MTLPPPIVAVHHLKLPVRDIDRSREWYESVVGLHVHTEFPDDDGVVRGVAGTLTDPSGSVVIALALRQNPDVAAGISGFDVLALSAADRADLEAWADHVAARGFERPRIQDGENGAILFLHDPDGLEIRLFSPKN